MLISCVVSGVTSLSIWCFIPLPLLWCWAHSSFNMRICTVCLSEPWLKTDQRCLKTWCFFAASTSTCIFYLHKKVNAHVRKGRFRPAAFPPFYWDAAKQNLPQDETVIHSRLFTQLMLYYARVLLARNCLLDPSCARNMWNMLHCRLQLCVKVFLFYSVLIYHPTLMSLFVHIVYFIMYK